MQVHVTVTVTARARNDLANLLAARSPVAVAATLIPMAVAYLDAIEVDLEVASGRPVDAILVGSQGGIDRYWWEYASDLGGVYEVEGRRARLFGVRVNVIGIRPVRPGSPPPP